MVGVSTEKKAEVAHVKNSGPKLSLLRFFSLCKNNMISMMNIFSITSPIGIEPKHLTEWPFWIFIAGVS